MYYLTTHASRWLAICVLMVSPTQVYSEQFFQQQGTPPLLIELYTSEGCSSCPPADAYIAEFADNPKLWQHYIPLAFHVDYWDYIGWKDRFAKAEFNQRQYDYRRHGHLRSVYTPGWLVNGREWRGFFSHRRLPSQQPSDGGNLRASLNGQNLEIHYKPSRPQQQLIAHVAILGFDLSSQVTAGENHGRRLEHQFVVLDKWQKPQLNYHWQFKLQRPTSPSRQALAIWITTPQLEPLQAAADWLQK